MPEEELYNLPPVEDKFLTEQEVRAIISSSMENMGTIRGGAGSDVFQFDRAKGIWLGASDFDNAPFKVTMKGVASAVGLNVEWVNITGTGKPADDADVTSNSPQDYSWVTGTKPPSNADNTAGNPQNLNWITDAGAMAYEDMVAYAKLDSTIIVGGYIKTSLLTADNIVTGVLTAVTARTNAATYPHAVMNSSGITIHGQYLTFRNTSGSSGGQIYHSPTYGLLMSSFSGNALKINSAANCNVNAGGSYLYLSQGNNTKIRLSSSAINCYVALSSTSSCNFAGITCNGNLSPNSTASNRYCGTSGSYWHRVYSDAYFAKNTTFQTFDKYDDLQILRDLKFDKKNKLVLKNLPKEIHDKGFINFGGMASFNLCASRKIVECVDDLKKTIDILTNRLNKLERKTI